MATPKAEPKKKSSDASAHRQELDQEIGAIYGEVSGKDEMNRLEQARHSTVRKIMVGFLVFFAALSVISWAGFFLFSPSDRKFSGEGVSLTIEGPEEVKSGEVTGFVIRWKNNERVPLGTASLRLRFPKEFTVRESDPPATDGEWQIGSIAPGKEGSVTVKGVFLAPSGAVLDVQDILSYRPADFNSDFQKVSTKGITIKDSVLTVVLSGPPKILPGDQVTFNIDYKNGSDVRFDRVRIDAEWPSNFLPESATVDSTVPEKNLWNIGTLDPGQSGTITVTGTFASSASGQNDIKARIGFLDASDNLFPQGESKITADVLEGNLVTALIVNGAAADQTANFGDRLRYSITYRNTGSAVLGDVSFTVYFQTTPDSSTILRWNDLRDNQRGIRDGNHLSWTKAQIVGLTKVRGNQEGAIDFELPLLQAPIDNTVGQPYAITSWVEATVRTIDDEKVDRTAKSQPIVVKILSDAKLTSDARYFNEDGVPLGSGPLPPVLGQQTVYRVTWNLANTLHELTDLKMSAKLPDNVIWTGKSTVDAGDLRFDAADGKMIWALNWLPTTIKNVSVNFDVGLTPTADQVGKVPTLIDATIMEATDKVAATKMLLSSPPLTTSLDNDSAAEGKARVQEK